MTKAFIVLALILVAGYGLKEALPLLMGPQLAVQAPTAFATATSGVLAVRGVANRVTHLSLDGSPLLRDENGSFATTLTFPRGTSILTFVATDRFGRSVTEHRTVFVP